MILGHGCGVPAYDQRELNAVQQAVGAAATLECVTRNTGVLESSSGLLGVAVASMQVATKTANARASSGGLLSTVEQPSSALVIGSSEIEETAH